MPGHWDVVHWADVTGKASVSTLISLASLMPTQSSLIKTLVLLPISRCVDFLLRSIRSLLTSQHLIANEQETYRRPYFGVEAVSSNVDDKTMHEFYLWPFADSVHAGVASVMCSYQRINGTYGCDNSKMLNGILKGELDFQGFVLLDWNAIHDLYSSNAGLDMVMPMGGSFGKNLTEAVGNGTVTEERVTDMATR